MTLAVLTGLRRGELSALRWNDLARGSLIIDEGTLTTPKGHRPERISRIGEKAYQALVEWKAKARFTEPDDFVFAIDTNTPIDMHNARARELRPACERLGIPMVSWHDRRHTYATWGRQAGVSPEVMRDQLGHASIKTTLAIYSHLAEVDETAATSVEGFVYGGMDPEGSDPEKVSDMQPRIHFRAKCQPMPPRKTGRKSFKKVVLAGGIEPPTS